ncbi:AAA family ATPase [Microvirga makkahensis]|uniref:AAA family ATPase n=1 Tax=Microvirga makkahensis TaxID=1128670 RepID=A0A7X3MU91_9HYPH|nr:AAA family ATPase [Microvirga makkahensis]MXQ13230.1 AAA family ATPase [Microvirga makkahensis]
MRMMVDPNTASNATLDWLAQRSGRKSKALPFIAFDDIQVEVEKPWLMKNVLARGDTSSWIGGPGKEKSAIVTDLCVHLGTGWDWRGYRSKERCAVVILAFERADLMLRRLEAYKRKHKLAELPVVVIRAPVDIMRPESVEILTDTIRTVEERFGLPVGVLVLDTYSKALALGGGDENSAKDVNRFLGHLRIVETQTNVHVCLIGHTGKDETRGHRGSNAHLGDVDLEITFHGHAPGNSQEHQWRAAVPERQCHGWRHLGHPGSRVGQCGRIDHAHRCRGAAACRR